jgi:hypothetical protein
VGASDDEQDESAVPDSEQAEKKEQRGRANNLTSPRTYPRRTLEQALRVPRALKDKNGGNSWSPKEVAPVLGLGPTSSNYFYLTAASRDYGLTAGTRDSASIALTDLGREAVYPGSDAQERTALRSAFLNVKPFRQVLEYYKGNSLPEYKYVANTLQTEFGIDPAYHEEFLDIFDKNCRYLGIGSDYEPDQAVATIFPADVKPAGKAAVVVGEPTRPAAGVPRVCFVIMPFSERDDRHATGFFEEVLVNLFTPAGTAAGFEVRTAQRHGSDVIQSTIVNDLLEADLVLADLTEHNPNVLFELGMRMAEDKPVVLVRAKGTGPIFDVDNMLRVEEYNPSLWKSTVEKDVPRLTEHILGAWENRDTGETFMKILRRQR